MWHSTQRAETIWPLLICQTQISPVSTLHSTVSWRSPHLVTVRPSHISSLCLKSLVLNLYSVNIQLQNSVHVASLQSQAALSDPSPLSLSKVPLKYNSLWILPHCILTDVSNRLEVLFFKFLFIRLLVLFFKICAIELCY